jgi:carboxypeptidase family protein/SdrD B-like protein
MRVRITAISVVACVLAAHGAAFGGPADAAWTVVIDDRELTVPIRQRPGAIPLVDVRMIARGLELSIEERSGRIVIRDVRGTEWTTADGSMLLDGPGGPRKLDPPALVAGSSIFLPLDCIAGLSDRTLVVTGRRASLTRVAVRTIAAAADTRVPAGWEPVAIAKTPAELAEMRRLDGDTTAADERPGVKDVQPPAHDTMTFDIGLGFAQGFSGAADVNVSGRTGATEVQLATFLTYGANGAEYRSARLTLHGATNRWKLEAGDLLSDVRGLARGLRAGVAVGTRWHPSVAVYMATPALSTTDRLAIAYRDDLQLPHDLGLRTEALSDRSHLAGARWIHGRASIDAFYRNTPVRGAAERGGMLSYNLFHGLVAQVGVRHATGTLVERWYFGALQVPIGPWAAMTLERTRKTHAPDGSAIALHVPIGRVRIMQRYQWTDVALLPDPAITAPGVRQLQSVASFSPVNRVQLSYQVATQWSAATVARQWTELQTVVTLSRATSLHAVTGLPDVANPQRFRFGLRQNLRRGFRLAVDYGRLPAFQAPTEMAAAETPRFLVMVRRNFSRATRAGGSSVSGRVVDGQGRVVPGAVVSLGPYVTTAAADGSYRFAHVPAGRIDLSLDAARLPAQFASDGATERLRIAPTGSVRRDLQAVPLRAIHGHVFVDRNDNGAFDAGEGVANVVMRLGDGASTMTDAGGAYGFYDLPPDRYEVRVDADRLDRNLTVASNAVLTVEVDGEGRATAGADFRLVPKDKPIVFQKGGAP